MFSWSSFLRAGWLEVAGWELVAGLSERKREPPEEEPVVALGRRSPPHRVQTAAEVGTGEVA